MLLYFLHASDNTPLSKSYEEIAPGQYKEETYPHVLKFDSLEYEAATLEEFHALLMAARENSLCLVKGILKNKLVNESRAGQTDSHEKTEWICLDVDYEVTGHTPEEFIDSLSDELVGSSFIFQQSVSTGIKTHTGWRGHFFLRLESPVSPQILKNWLVGLNLRHPALSQRLELSASGSALRFPLDVTTCQNDKLIYITDPICKNFDPPEVERFKLYSRERETVKITDIPSPTKNQKDIQTVIAELRKSANLEKKSFNVKTHTTGQEIVLNPDPMVISEIKEARGFVYLNINDGDSWAYYFPESNPDIVWNFKGEPAFYLRDIDPELHSRYNQRSTGESGSDIVPLVFRWRTDDLYYNGHYDASTGHLLNLHSTNSKAKLKDFLIENGVVPDKQWTVADWEIEFNPTGESGKVDVGAQHVNVYRMPEIAAKAEARDVEIPPTIGKVLDSICVDEPTREYFLNWLAYIFQTRKKTGTAWIFQGVEGTGKGVLFAQILAPLLGRDYCYEMTMDRIDDQFNSYLERNIILFIDEANVQSNNDKAINRLKNLITEDHLNIRRMRTNPINLPNYTNVILASNHDEIIPLSITDRRFNVAPRQETPLMLEYEDIVRIGEELSDFASHLKGRQVDEKTIKRILDNDARMNLIELSKTSIDHLFQAIHKGDLEYFIQFLKSGSSAEEDYIKYQIVIDEWIANAGEKSHVTREQLRTCYQYIQSARIGPAKFSRLCAKYHLHMRNIRIGEKIVKGINDFVWQLSDELKDSHEKADNVVSIKGR